MLLPSVGVEDPIQVDYVGPKNTKKERNSERQTSDDNFINLDINALVKTHYRRDRQKSASRNQDCIPDHNHSILKCFILSFSDPTFKVVLVFFKLFSVGFIVAHPIAPINSRPTSIRRISEVPAPISISLASRNIRATGASFRNPAPPMACTA